MLETEEGETAEEEDDRVNNDECERCKLFLSHPSISLLGSILTSDNENADVFNFSKVKRNLMEYQSFLKHFDKNKKKILSQYKMKLNQITKAQRILHDVMKFNRKKSAVTKRQQRVAASTSSKKAKKCLA